MPSKLTSDSIRAELSSINKLIEEAEQYGDFVGASQFKYRQSELEKELNESSYKNKYTASVALFFSGKPVYGSRGINADFAGKALDSFQEIVSKIFSLTEIGTQSKRGPVAFSKSSKLAITGVAQGSFGFLLDEITEQQSLIKTELRHVIENVTELLDKTVSPDESEFEEATEKLDKRALLAFSKFFKNLDSNGAKLKLVEGNSEHFFDSESIRIARNRIENTSIEEKVDTIEAEMFGFLPDSRKFELKIENKIIFGLASKVALESFEKFMVDDSTVLGHKVEAKLETRVINKVGAQTKYTYRLIDFDLINND